MVSCITTYTKESFDPTAPDCSKLNIRDVAHALSLLCRANGHFPIFYSVAQHCLNCMAEAQVRGYSRRVQLACLLHDATEAYVQDLPRPVKNQLSQYNEIEDTLLQTIWAKWLDAPLTDEERRLVFEVDDAMLYHEFLYFMNQEVVAPQELKSDPVLCTEPFKAVEQKYLESFYGLSTTEASKTFIGVDGCKGKWLAAVLRDEFLNIELYDSISNLCNAYQNADSVIIDVPIGLAENCNEDYLRPDQYARNYLKNKDRKSSVFNAPYRSVVYASDYKSANDLSRKLGKGLSSQSWAICSAIRQVDEFLQSNPQWKNRLIESHPEVAFQALNHEQPIENSKHTAEGISERICILEEHIPDIGEIIRTSKSNIHEDILDASCLAVTGMLGTNYGFSTIPVVPATDHTGLKMQIVISKTN